MPSMVYVLRTVKKRRKRDSRSYKRVWGLNENPCLRVECVSLVCEVHVDYGELCVGRWWSSEREGGVFAITHSRCGTSPRTLFGNSGHFAFTDLFTITAFLWCSYFSALLFLLLLDFNFKIFHVQLPSGSTSDFYHPLDRSAMTLDYGNPKSQTLAKSCKFIHAKTADQSLLNSHVLFLCSIRSILTFE